MNNYSVTVVIPTFNSSKYIHNALDSISYQTHTKLEVIVVDDDSSDKYELSRVIDSYKKNIDIKLFFNEIKKNASYSRNFGAERATSDFICFLDADDIFLPEKIELQVRSMVYFDLDWSYTQLYHCKCSQMSLLTHRMKKPIRGIRTNEPFYDYIFLDNGLIQTSTLMISKKIISFVTFNEKLPRHQDYDYCVNLFRKKFKGKFINKPLTYWILPEEYVSPITKKQSIVFCLNWLEEQDLSESAKINYLLHNVVLVSLKSKSLSSLIYFFISDKTPFTIKCRVFLSFIRYAGLKLWVR